MEKKDIAFTLEIPKHIWQNLVAMAAEDMRTENEFLQWLIHRASMDRGLFASSNPNLSPDTLKYKRGEENGKRS